MRGRHSFGGSGARRPRRMRAEVPGSPQYRPLRSGRGSAEPQSALFNPRRRVGRAAGGATGVRAVYRPRCGRAAGTGAPRGRSDSGQRWGFSRRPNPHVPLAGRRQMERRVAGYGRRCDLYPARNPRSAQPRALARRLRSHRPRVRTRDRASSSFTCGGRGRPPRRRTFRTAFHRSSFCRRTSCERSRRWREPLSMRNPASATVRTVFCRGDAAKGCDMSPIRATGAASPRSQRSRFERFPTLRPICFCCNRASWTGISSLRLNWPSCAAIRIYVSSRCRPPSWRDWL